MLTIKEAITVSFIHLQQINNAISYIDKCPNGGSSNGVAIVTTGSGSSCSAAHDDAIKKREAEFNSNYTKYCKCNAAANKFRITGYTISNTSGQLCSNMSYAYVNSAVIKLSITPLGTPCSYSGTVTGNWTANTASGTTSGSVPINISAASKSGQTILFGVTQVRCETIKFTFSKTEFTCS